MTSADPYADDDDVMAIIGNDDEIHGWVRLDGCTEASCLAAVAEGRPYHAIPRVGVLDDYHFVSDADAIDAVMERVVPEDDELGEDS